MIRKGFLCRNDYLRKFEKLTDDDFGLVIRACIEYHATGNVPELQGDASLAFDEIRADIDAMARTTKAKGDSNSLQC